MIYNRKTSQPESPWGSLVTLLLSIKITGKMLKHCYFNGHRDKTPDILAEAFGKEAPDAIRTGWGWHKPEPWTLSGCDGFWALTAVPGGLCQICDFSAPTQLPAQRWSFSPCRLCLASPAAQKTPLSCAPALRASAAGIPCHLPAAPSAVHELQGRVLRALSPDLCSGSSALPLFVKMLYRVTTFTHRHTVRPSGQPPVHHRPLNTVVNLLFVRLKYVLFQQKHFFSQLLIFLWYCQKMENSLSLW